MIWISLQEKKDVLKEVVKFLNYKYGGDIVQLEIEDSYYNMKEKKLSLLWKLLRLLKKSYERSRS